MTEPRSKYFIAGASAGCCSRAIAQPLDVVKIRFQLQFEPITSHCSTSKYTGLIQAFRTIIAEESYRGLWKGHLSAQALSVVYGAVSFPVFEISSRMFDQHLPWFYGSSFVCGALAGSTGSLAAMPFDVIRTRLVSHKTPKYNNFRSVCRWIWKYEGVKGFFSGSVATQLSVIPSAGLTFSLYRIFTRAFKAEDSTIGKTLCGSSAGLIAKLCLYPLDLLKKRAQLQGFQRVRQGLGKNYYYRGLWDACRQIYAQESLRGFFKGLWPSLIKAYVISGLYFGFYNLSLQVLNTLQPETGRG